MDFSFIGELFSQFVQWEPGPPPDGGTIFHLSIPERLELTKSQAMILWGILHIAYGLLTHWYSLLQVRAYNLKAEAKDKVRDRDVWTFFIGRMLFAFEVKILNALWVVLIRVYCNVIAPFIQGNMAGATRKWLDAKDLYKFRLIVSPAEMLWWPGG